MVVTPDPISTLLKLTELSKAPSPMVVTEFGIYKSEIPEL